MTDNKQPTRKHWIGNPPERCDLCGVDLVIEFIDGATRQGPWGFMCLSCHTQHGRGLGVGRGQHYVRSVDGLFYRQPYPHEQSSSA